MSLALLVSYAGFLGGAERALLDWTAALPGERRLACPPGPLADAARAAGLTVSPLTGGPLELVRAGTARTRAVAALRLIRHRREIAELARVLEPELLILNGMRPALAATRPVRIPCGGRVVMLHHDLLPGGWIGRAVRNVVRSADRVVVPSRAVAADLGLGEAGGRVRVVHPGIDVARFAAAARSAPASPPEVLVLGALVAWKRIDLALEAIALVRRRRPDVRLRIVGAPLPGAGPDDPHVVALRARAAAADLAGAVTFAGAVADPAPELARACCLLHCADHEPFGLVVAEALAAGRPAIVPAGSGPAEIVDAGCGLAYAPGDAAAAAAAVLSLLDDPVRAAELGACGRRRAVERFRADAAAAAFARAIAS